MDTVKTKKIKNLLDAIKLEVDDIDQFSSDIDSVIGMFNQLNDVDVNGIDASLNRKKVGLGELRNDTAVDAQFRKDMRGQYFKVPSVSRK